ncbi:MAG: DUF790 family protein [Deltaproteobacteria bacterium]|nr:DUF790 family protein [Deltaproteobacteria bacterium]
MLTKDLLRVSVKGKELVPSLIDPADPKRLERAAELLDLMGEALEGRWRRGEVHEAVEQLIGEARDQKIVRGIAKVLLDKAEFEVSAPLDPVELRARVFRLAAQRGPLALEPGLFGRPVAETVLAELGQELGVSPAALAESLYADLNEEQRLSALPPLSSPEALLHRYNVSLVAALLADATEVRVRLDGPSPERLRQLFRYVKFFELIHRFSREGQVVHLTLDGPASVLRSSTRYGRQLARLFPALLLQSCPWELEADVLWTKARYSKRLHLTHTLGLVSHYRDQGAWRSRELTWLEERLAKRADGWTISGEVEPLLLGAGTLILPDARLERDGRVAWIEIVGYWRRDYLRRRLDALNRWGPGNLILAVSRKLMTEDEDLSEFAGEVVPFTQAVPVRELLAAAERVAR